MRYLIVAFIALFAAVPAWSQEVKIGYVQVEYLISNFPEHEDASKTYEKEVSSWQTQLNQYQDDLAGMEEEYKQRSMLYSPEKKREKEEEILNKRKEAVQFYQDYFGPQGKAEQRKIELLSPIYDKVNRAIEIFGERESYSMIFNAQGLLYAKDGYDCTEKVLEILRAGVDTAPAPAGGSSSGR